jgi:Antirestriction protein
MNNPTDLPSGIIATLVPDSRRLSFLPKTFGRLMMKVEQEVFSQMAELCDDYRGGYWHFFELSNGGGFLASAGSDPVKIVVEGNGYAGSVSAEAAGIIATLFALSHLAFRHSDADTLSERFHQLRDFALGHPEREVILAAID